MNRHLHAQVTLSPWVDFLCSMDRGLVGSSQAWTSLQRHSCRSWHSLYWHQVVFIPS